ncbi:MAG TPA: undecaprenyl/decaprenyl-phosphate alpha-N-acetylglucosaminyl 1-phosphate transferase [Trebonia sp.]|jgi:UDP-GlcNAc:undecaprenyl-phosphate GlcNAc-1-phosphate transferase|nr:undecaprenyl/decaprenyl-phosphate alpha-N-acetylglucosaminyl 1-phosphate transferase [Trebonia sp.]
MREYLYVLIIAAAVTYLLTPLVRRGAIGINAQHAPRSRDVHTSPTPLLGGLAMYGGLVVALLVAERLPYLQGAFPSSRTVTGLLLAAGLLVLIGAVDDRWEIGALAKLAGQIAAGGIVAWSGATIPWMPLPSGGTLTLEPDLSYTVTILIIVATINAVNFIDGLDGLAAGIVGISALSFMVYSYTLTNSVGIPSQSVPAVESAVLAGICIGFLPHNFNPARIFMGDTGSMLLGLLLAYGPISSTASLDNNILINYASNKPVDRFATILPLLLPIAILIIPYTDLLLAVVRRMVAGQSPFAADRMHLHHRLQNLGHSHRQTVLLMYLWAALFSGTVVGLSVIRVQLIWLALATVGAVIALLLATMPKLRPWRSTGKRAAGTRSRHRVGVTPVRSIDPMTATASPAAAARGPVPTAMPPVLSAPTAEPPGGPAGPFPPTAGPAGNAGRAGQAPEPGQNGRAPQPPGLNGHAPQSGQNGRAPQPPGLNGRAPQPGQNGAARPSRHARNAGATRP